MLFKKVKVKRLLEYDPEFLIANLPASFNLEYEDGTIELVKKNPTIYSRLYWEIFKYFPIPITKEYHASRFVKTVPDAKTHREVWSTISFASCDSYGFVTPDLRDPVLEKLTEIHSNVLYRNLVKITPKYMSALCALDLHEIYADLRIREIKKNTQPTYESLEDAANQILALVKSDSKFKNNSVSRSLATGMINSAQLRELVANCGVRSDIDGSIIPWFVPECYYAGMRHPISRAVDYRTATQAMRAADAGLKEAAYKSRVIAILTSAVGSLKYGDCGTQHYLDWHVQPPCEVAGEKYPGDFKMLIGKNFLDEDTGKVRFITKQDTHLINKVIKLRYVNGCSHADQHHFCSTCFGQLADNMGPGEALGHKATVEIMAILIQRQLSAKHNIASAASMGIILNASTRRFFTVSDNGRSFILLDQLKQFNPVLVLPGSVATGLLDIITSDKPAVTFDLAKAGELVYVGISLTENNQETIHRVTVSDQKTKANITYELINHIRAVGYKTDKKGNLLVDLSAYSENTPLLTVPPSTFNPAAFTEEFTQTLGSSNTKRLERSQNGQANELLTHVFRMVNMRLEIPLSVVETIIYGLTVENDKGSMMLGRGNPNPGLGVADTLTGHRSASAQLAYEESHNKLLDPIMHKRFNKPNNIYDVFITPNEVVNDPYHFNNLNNRLNQKL